MRLGPFEIHKRKRAHEREPLGGVTDIPLRINTMPLVSEERVREIARVEIEDAILDLADRVSIDWWDVEDVRCGWTLKRPPSDARRQA